MYFPYLRGKQYELLAIREFCAKIVRIHPVIAPVKSSSTFYSTIATLTEAAKPHSIIVNPYKGGFVDELNDVFNTVSECTYSAETTAFAIIVNRDTNVDEIVDAIAASDLGISQVNLVHLDERMDVDARVAHVRANFQLNYNLVDERLTGRRYYRSFPGTAVDFGDHFIKRNRNADYLAYSSSSFSEAHLWFEEEGFVGFGDFVTVGDNFSSEGFSPYAVAIHLSYFDEKRKVRIRHFVSDSNDDPTDPAGKFGEAIGKLYEWVNGNPAGLVHTAALADFLELHNTGHYPGLGMIKKLSILHHFEMIQNEIS